MKKYIPKCAKDFCRFFLLVLCVFTFLVVGSGQALAQVPAGSSCVTAIDLGQKDTCSNGLVISDSIMWFKFTAGGYLGTSISVRNLQNNTSGYVYKMDIYSGSCTNLNLFAHKFLYNSGDTSELKIDTSGYMLGSTYYLKVTSHGYVALFNLCVQYVEPFCGFDAMMKQLQQINPNFQQRIDSIENDLRDKLPSVLAGPYTIPVVVHVMHRAGDVYGAGFNISYDQIKWQLQALNAAFAKNYPAYNGQSHGSSATNTLVNFCLASIPYPNTPSGPQWAVNPNTGQQECGVMRYPVPDLVLEHNMASDQNELLTVTHPNGTTVPGGEFPFDMYLNIWLVGEICDNASTPQCDGIPNQNPGVVGYGTMPGFPANNLLDGIVFRSDCFGDNSLSGNSYPLFPALNQGKILAHEAGHYLELWHVHDPSPMAGPTACVGTTGPTGSDPCDVNGDRCCDTPPTTTLNVTSCTNPASNACGFPDQRENYMSYSDDNCMNTFTGDQTLRIDYVLSVGGFRDFLVSAANLTATGAVKCDCNTLVANIGYSPAHPCPGTSVCFTTTNGAGAVSWQWDFGDGCSITGSGTISSGCATGTFINPCHTYSATGTYTVTLTVTDSNGNSYMTSVTITVTTPSAAITGPSPAPTVCNGSHQCVTIQYTGNNPPWTAVLTDGAASYTVTSQQAGTCWPVTVNSANPTFTLVSLTDALLCNGTVSGSVTYSVITCCPDQFVNGNFANCNHCCIIPATTQYGSGNTCIPPNWPSSQCGTFHPGYYAVYNSSATSYGNWPPSGGNWPQTGYPPTGNTMVVDGYDCVSVPPMSTNNPANHAEVWCQTVAIQPNTNYIISFFISEVYDPLQIQLKINNQMVPAPIISSQIPPGAPSTWRPVNINWNSGTNCGLMPVCVCQVNNFQGGGYDYLLDNFSIRATAPTVVVNAGADQTICSGSCVSLTASGCTGNYSWAPSTGLNCTTCPNPIACPPTTITYTVTSVAGCTGSDMVTVFVLPSPILSVSITPSTCAGSSSTLTASGASTYTWTPATGLSSTTGATVTANPPTATTYTVTGTDPNGCTASTIETVYPCSTTGTGKWPKQGAGTSGSTVKSNTILVDNYGSVYMTGFFYGPTDFTEFGTTLTPATAIDMFVLKYDACGNNWIRQFGNDDPSGFSSDNTGLDLAIALDGSLIVTGKYDRNIKLDNFTLNSGLINQGFIAKLDACTGAVQAAYGPVSTGGAFAAVAASTLPPGNIYVAGKQFSASGSLLVSKFDINLNTPPSPPPLLTTAFLNAVDPDDHIFGLDDNITRGIALDNQDNVYVAVNLNGAITQFGTPPPFTNVVQLTGASIAKFDQNIVPVTGLDLVPFAFDKVRDLVVDGAGDCYSVGRTQPPTASPSLIVAKTPASLATCTTWTYNGRMGTSIDVDGTHFYFSGMDGSTVLAGKANKTTGTATAVYESSYSANAMGCNSISHDASGNAFIAGGFEGTVNFIAPLNSTATSPRSDMFAARLNPSGVSFKIGEQNEQETPDTEKVFDAILYPNPTTGILFVKLEGISSKESADVEIIDGKGLVLYKEKIAGPQNIFRELNMEIYANGVYLVKIISGGNIVCRKISLNK